MTPREDRADPHYQRIRRQLEMQIRRGALSPGERIPGEREIARETGVSQMTVNRAIQELVRSGWLVRRVGAGTFVCDADARPAAERTVVFALPLPSDPEDDVYLQEPFQAVRQLSAAEGCSLIVSEVPDGHFTPVVDRAPHAAFIFAMPMEQHRDALAAIYEQGVPFAVMGASWPGAPFACVDSDNAAGARTAVEYLIRLGHRRIAFVAGIDDAPNCRDRIEGYRRALAEHGIGPDDTHVVPAGSNWEQLDGQCRRDLTALLLRRDPVTAFFCAGYYISLGVYSLLQSLALRVPDDVSVVGFDDPRSARHVNPPLTTVRQPLAALGERALRRALDQLECPAETPGVEYLPVELIVRESCRRLR